jgi:hypothetical protein
MQRLDFRDHGGAQIPIPLTLGPSPIEDSGIFQGHGEGSVDLTRSPLEKERTFNTAIALRDRRSPELSGRGVRSRSAHQFRLGPDRAALEGTAALSGSAERSNRCAYAMTSLNFGMAGWVFCRPFKTCPIF